MYYAKIINEDTNNGKGFRVSLFVSGCARRKCKSCHNKAAWNFKYGQKYTKETEDKILELLSKKQIKGLSILGGEPMDNLQDKSLLNLVEKAKKLYPEKNIYCWTGYEIEELLNSSTHKEFFKYIDMLRDGEYIEKLKDLSQYLQGSKNQRYIDIQKTLKNDSVIEFKVN